MADISSEMLPRLINHRLQELDLGDELVYPVYSGGSLLNIPASICQFLGVPGIHQAPLWPEVIERLGIGYRQVLLILADALSFQRFMGWTGQGRAPVWEQLAQDGLLSPLTSITPSTTSAVLNTLWTGRSAAEHGIVGYELWLKEYGVVANMITHAPITFKGDAGGLRRAGFTPDGFMPFRTLGTHLAGHGVKTFALQHHSLARSGLSDMFFRDIQVGTFNTNTDLWVNARHLLESQASERQFVWVYWGDVDHFSHFYGPDDERTVEEFTSFSAALERHFLSRLSPAARRDTLLILLADHGQITTTPDPYYDLANHPSLTRRLHILPTGENRLAYLFVRPGQGEAVREYVERTWPRQFYFLDPVYAVEAGLFGPGERHPRLLDRLGDFILIARGRAFLWWGSQDDHLLGRHGGLSPEEMLVPFLAARLDG